MHINEKKRFIKSIRSNYHVYGPSLDEKQKRMWAAMEAKKIGRGGIHCTHRATGISRFAIRAGLKELVSREFTSDLVVDNFHAPAQMHSTCRNESHL